MYKKFIICEGLRTEPILSTHARTILFRKTETWNQDLRCSQGSADMGEKAAWKIGKL